MPNIFIDLSAAAPPSTAIIEDDFSGSAGSINGRTPNIANDPGNNWAVVNGSLAINGSGELDLPGSGDNSALIDLELANGFFVEVEAQLSSGAYLGVNVNASGYNNSWEFGVYGGGTLMEVYYNILGSYILVTTGAASVTADTPFTVRVDVNASGFEFYFNGSSIGTCVRGTNILLDAATQIGLIGVLGSGLVFSYKADSL